MTDLCFEAYRRLRSPGERTAFRAAMHTKGYFAFYGFVEDFRGWLKSYADEDIGETDNLLSRAREDFPQPERFSPSWGRLWEEFEGICRAKNEVLAAVPFPAREGEWQVLIDNPFLPQQVVCYPALAFGDAAYMFAYFQKDLKPNEILRFQRVTHLLTKSGLKEASIFPDV
jgi:hypothetical protein